MTLLLYQYRDVSNQFTENVRNILIDFITKKSFILSVFALESASVEHIMSITSLRYCCRGLL